MENFFLDFFLKTSIRDLNNIVRWNNVTKIKLENVAQHSYWVAVISDCLFEYIIIENSFEEFCKSYELENEQEKNLDRQRIEYYVHVSSIRSMRYTVLNLALYHDSEEILIGDINYDVKYPDGVKDENLQNALKKILDKKLSDFSKEFVEDDVMSKYILKTFLNDVGDNVAHTKFFGDCKSFPNFLKDIVKLADWLACVFYSFDECILGNNVFKNHYFPKCVEKTILHIEKMVKIYELESPQLQFLNILKSKLNNLLS